MSTLGPIDVAPRRLQYQTTKVSTAPTKPFHRLSTQADQVTFGQAKIGYEQWPYGASVNKNGVRFKLWAPAAEKVELLKIRSLTPTEKTDAEHLDLWRKREALAKAKKTVLLEQNENERHSWNLATQDRNRDIAQQINQIDRLLIECRHAIDALKKKVPAIKDRILPDGTLPLSKDGRGNFYTEQQNFQVGTVNPNGMTQTHGNLYMYRLTYPVQDGMLKDAGFANNVSQILPDPWSRYQPEDVHGPSEVVDSSFPWDPKAEKFWNNPNDMRKLAIYRLHVGTFSEDGTFDGVIKKLDELKEMGYTAVELMPVHEFPGKRNWGYDGVGFFAIESSYGRPEDLKRLVNECHKRNMAVTLDVVFNHIGPEGNYLGEFDRNFLNHRATPWGPGFNFDYANPQYNPKIAPGKYNAKKPSLTTNPALDFVLQNVQYLVNDFHIDGFRFDQTGYIPKNAMRQITQTLYSLRPSSDLNRPKVILMAEDGRDENFVTTPPHESVLEWGGLGFKAQWNFDFYHLFRGLLTGKPHMNNPTDIGSFASFLWQGFRNGDKWLNNLWNGVLFPESHDEAGNYDGSRIHKLIEHAPGKARIANVMQYLIPGIPFNFMGHEYGEKNPFYFFADMSDPGIILGLTRGRWHSEQPGLSTDVENFNASRLSWQKDPGLYKLSKDILALRQQVPALWQGERWSPKGEKILDIHHRYLSSNILALHRKGFEEPQAKVNYQDEVFIVMNASDKDYAGNYVVDFPAGEWQEILTTESPEYGGREGWNNTQKLFTSGERPINLAANSTTIFRRRQAHGVIPPLPRS
jgi:maltooligosyltrehalose trehalohydrolase